jgi:hypothetical protein
MLFGGEKEKEVEKKGENVKEKGIKKTITEN